MIDKKQSKNNAAEGAENYRAEHITVLDGLAPVRKRPAMYIGSTGSDGLHHMVYEVLDNGIDEAMAGFATQINLEILPDSYIRVEDNGRGIPVDIHKQTGKPALEVVMTKLHAGAKFEKSIYKVSGGLHGVGVSVVNALSESLRAEVKRDGALYAQEYKKGLPAGKVKKIGTAKGTGTIVLFKPDKEIFPDINFSFSRILEHVRQQAYLTKGVKFLVIDKRKPDREIPYLFYFEGGIISYIKYLNRTNTRLQSEIFYGEKEVDEIKVEVALQYVDDYKENIYTFTNNIYNPAGGTHLAGFRTALTRTLNNYARKREFFKDGDENFIGDDLHDGLTSVISVKVKEPQFEGQTKSKLGNPEVKGVVDSVFSELFGIFLEEHPKEGEAIFNKCLLSAKARVAAKKAKEAVLRKGALEGLSLPGKLADCGTSSPERAEIFIVEGDSAGGCFSGETEVALTDGRNLSFKDLVEEDKKGKRNYCYTVKEDGSIGIALIKHPRKTKIATEVIKIILDNQKEIICTPDHKFMLRNGLYKEAHQLISKDSLMPFRRQLSRLGKRITIKGYELIYDPKEQRWIFTHLLADRYNLNLGVYAKEKGDTIHHLDFNKTNNNPDNLMRMVKKDHLFYHSNLLEKTLHREDIKEKSRQAHQSEEYRKKIREIMSTPKMRKILSARAKKQWANKEYKEFMAQKFIEFYKGNEAYQEKNNKLLYEAQKKYWSNFKNRSDQAEKVRNYFEQQPEKKTELSEKAKKQWQNEELLKWRRQKTREQWIPEFRAKRKIAYNKTYQEKSIRLMREILDRDKNFSKERYDSERLKRNDKSILRYETICQRFFENDDKRLKEAILNYNHKIKKIIRLEDRIDVYDFEVEETHNFALASGIFVHNSCKQGRDREIQAVLPLRGKIINVEKSRIDKILANNEIKSLIIALGTNIGELFNLEKLRYHKIIIATDADVDGSHIKTLLLTFFYRYLKPIIENGYLYIAKPPLYRIKAGREIEYAYSDEEKDKITKGFEKKEKIGVSNFKVKAIGAKEAIEEKETKIDIQRYKGLGEMNPEELFETTMDPARRALKRISIEDAERADEIFEILLGKEVLPRKKFIQLHAKSVQNLDI